MAKPRLFLAALPSGVRSMPRCLAMAADTGVISSSPTPILLVVSSPITGHKTYNKQCFEIIMNGIKFQSMTWGVSRGQSYHHPSRPSLSDPLGQAAQRSLPWTLGGSRWSLGAGRCGQSHPPCPHHSRPPHSGPRALSLRPGLPPQPPYGSSLTPPTSSFVLVEEFDYCFIRFMSIWII